MRAPAALVAAGAGTAAAVAAGLRVTGDDAVPLVTAHAATVHPGERRGEEEEDAVHDAQGEAGLEHAAGLVRVQAQVAARVIAEGPQRDAPVDGADDGAVGAGDEAQRVDAGDEGADEAQIDQGNELRVGAAAVVAEQGEDGPEHGDHGDDKEDHDVVGRQLVVAHEAVDEVGQYAQRGNLRRKEGRRRQHCKSFETRLPRPAGDAQNRKCLERIPQTGKDQDNDSLPKL